MTPLDPTHPLVLDTKPLGRRAGAMRTIDRTLPAPEGWTVSSSSVEPGSPITLQLRMESVVEGVLVSGQARAATVAECSRCLDEIHGELEVQIQQLFEYPDQQLPPTEADDEPLPALQGDLIDLEPTLRDAVVLELPLVPICSPQCPGLCPTCGAKLADEPDHRHEEYDSRWAGLRNWTSNHDQVSAEGAEHDPSITKGD